MKCLAKRLKIIEDTLKTVSDNVGHYEELKKNDQYIIWAEDGAAGRLAGNNAVLNQAIQGTIDYFTRQDEDPAVDAIQDALKKAGIPSFLNSVQYEHETGYIHYEWVFEVS